MKTNIFSVLLLVALLQTGCSSNVQPNICVNNVQQNKQNSNDDSVNLIMDEVAIADNVYKQCSKKFMNLIKNPNDKHFFEFENVFVYADDYSESILFNLAAANKLGLGVAKIRVANRLTQSLSNPYIGKHSKEIALFFLKKWASSTKHKRSKQIIERFELISADETEFIVPVTTYKSSKIQCLKAGALKGSTEDYEKLKEIMSNDEMYAFFLYYAYVMADRYDYEPAKKDVVSIINRFYRDYNLEPIDKDTQYFCSFFR